jgi:hypothetical protein
MERETGFEPATLSLGRSSITFVNISIHNNSRSVKRY